MEANESNKIMYSKNIGFCSMSLKGTTKKNIFFFRKVYFYAFYQYIQLYDKRYSMEANEFQEIMHTIYFNLCNVNVKAHITHINNNKCYFLKLYIRIFKYMSRVWYKINEEQNSPCNILIEWVKAVSRIILLIFRK